MYKLKNQPFFVPKISFLTFFDSKTRANVKMELIFINFYRACSTFGLFVAKSIFAFYIFFENEKTKMTDLFSAGIFDRNNHGEIVLHESVEQMAQELRVGNKFR